MGEINFSKYKIPQVTVQNGKKYIYDRIRKRNVPFTPEEKVRQQVLTYIIEELKVPEYMIDEEVALSYYKADSIKRPDILILRKDELLGDVVPLAVIECKRNNTIIDGNIIEQTLYYANQLNCRYAMITDGLYVDVAYYEKENDYLTSIQGLPIYSDMIREEYVKLRET